jgi:hypothetical protein
MLVLFGFALAGAIDASVPAGALNALLLACPKQPLDAVAGSVHWRRDSVYGKRASRSLSRYLGSKWFS